MVGRIALAPDASDGTHGQPEANMTRFLLLVMALVMALVLALLTGCHHAGSGPGGSWHL